MRKLAFVIACLAAGAAAAQANRKIALRVHDSKVMQVFAATAAYTVDASIAEASAHGGTVTLFGRSAGTTQLIVLSVTGQSVFDVTVESRGQIAPVRQSGPTNGTIETRYVSAQKETEASIDLATRQTQLHIESAHYGEKQSSRAGVTLPSVSFRIFRGRNELTFLDRVIDHSPLTIDTATVRGLHFVNDRWRAHAGYTAYTAYQSFLIPTERQTVLGAAYSIPASARWRITPGLFTYPSVQGTVGSLLVDYTRDENTRARGELAASNGSVGAAAQLVLNRETQQMRLDVRYRPRDFAVVTPGQQRGLFADGSWSGTFGRTSIDASASLNDFDLPAFRQRTASATANGRYRLTDSVSLLGGAGYGSFAGSRSLIIPAGVQFDTGRFGVSGVYRWSENSSTNRGGNGFRIAARLSAGRFFSTAYIDHQEQAPTLALIFRERPDLALALERLGITATTPGDIARALRENSALIELGYIEGVTVELAPVRTQAGMEMAWLGAGASRPQLRARFLFNRQESVAMRTDTVIATLSGSRRITESTDVFASYTLWLTRRRGQEEVQQPIAEIGLRHRFDELPSFGASGTIRGSVFVDEDLDGSPDGGGVADAEIDVDGARVVKTSKDGSYEVSGISRGAHRVTARVPHIEGAFFTTPSRVEANSGDVVRFGIARTPARLIGRVVSDAGEGVGGVMIAVTRGSSRFTATSTGDGRFSIAAPPGEWDLAVDAMSVPPGFSTGAAQLVRLDRAEPLSVSLQLRANRSISGRATPGVTSITVDPLARQVPVAADGRYSIRSLPAGSFTLRARLGGRVLQQQVTLPDEPTVLNDVNLR